MNFLRALVKSNLRVFGVVFVMLFFAMVIHGARQPLMFEASGTVKFHGHDDESSHHSGAGMEDGNKMRLALKSSELIQRVALKFSEVDRGAFLMSNNRSPEQPEAVLIERLIGENQRVFFDRLERAVIIRYQHPDRFMAARVVNFLMEGLIGHQARLRIDETMKAVDQLKIRAAQQQRRVWDVMEEMSAYRERMDEKTGKPFESDVTYGAMKQGQDREQKLLDAIIRRLRETTIFMGPRAQFWRISEKAEVPAENDYLIAPMVRRLAWGFAVAVVGGLLTVGVMNVFSRRRGPDKNRPVIS